MLQSQPGPREAPSHAGRSGAVGSKGRRYGGAGLSVLWRLRHNCKLAGRTTVWLDERFFPHRGPSCWAMTRRWPRCLHPDQGRRRHGSPEEGSSLETLLVHSVSDTDFAFTTAVQGRPCLRAGRVGVVPGTRQRCPHGPRRERTAARRHNLPAREDGSFGRSGSHPAVRAGPVHGASAARLAPKRSPTRRTTSPYTQMTTGACYTPRPSKTSGHCQGSETPETRRGTARRCCGSMDG